MFDVRLTGEAGFDQRRGEIPSAVRRQLLQPAADGAPLGVALKLQAMQGCAGPSEDVRNGWPNLGVTDRQVEVMLQLETGQSPQSWLFCI
jgi:hypothetical protein